MTLGGVDRFQVLPYTFDEFVRIAAEPAARPDALKEKVQFEYLKEYLTAMKAATMVVEYAYTDRDFLEDFASFYVRCFQDYKSTCLRVHFFTSKFSEAELTQHIEGNGKPKFAAKLQPPAYLGFTVLKPLPRTVVGRTCLAVYPPNGPRQYPTKRRYDVHLFGTKLWVETVAFQEQDSVAAACATSALWVAFQCTGAMFGHSVPSPVEITRAAVTRAAVATRSFPNRDGLQAPQMADAIRAVGLEPTHFEFKRIALLKAAIYGYLRAGVPVILLVAIVDKSNPPHGAAGAYVGLHAVTVTGFNTAAAVQAEDPFSALFQSSAIDQLYAHDDQVGPFARMPFVGPLVVSGGGQVAPYEALGTSSAANPASIGSFAYIPLALLVPLYHKVRIPFDTVLTAVDHIDTLIEALRPSNTVNIPSRIHWDVFLSTSSDFKDEIARDKPVPANVLLDLLTLRLPRFVWRAVARVDGQRVFEFLFDATDVEQGRIFLQTVAYDAATVAELKNMAPHIAHLDVKPGVQAILDWLRE